MDRRIVALGSICDGASFGPQEELDKCVSRSSRSYNGLERHVRTIKKELTKKKALSSYDFLDELSEHVQEKSEDLVEGEHVDDILCCATGMGSHHKTSIR